MSRPASVAGVIRTLGMRMSWNGQARERFNYSLWTGLTFREGALSSPKSYLNGRFAFRGAPHGSEHQALSGGVGSAGQGGSPAHHHQHDQGAIGPSDELAVRRGDRRRA